METLIEVVARLIHLVRNQQITIEDDIQRRKVDELSNASIHSINSTHDLSVKESFGT